MSELQKCDNYYHSIRIEDEKPIHSQQFTCITYPKANLEKEKQIRQMVNTLYIIEENTSA